MPTDRSTKYCVYFFLTSVGVSALVWNGLNIPISVVRLLPCIMAILFTPGFIITQLAFSNFSKKLETIESIPLWFGLSVGIWVIVGIFAFRFQMSVDLIINGVIVFDFVGLFYLFISQKVLCHSFVEEQESVEFFEWGKFYKFVFIVLVVSCSVLVAYKAQYQRLDYDTWYHLANIRKIIDNTNIIGGAPFFKLGDPGTFAYASHAFYLALALICKMSGVSVGWNYVVMSGILTALFLFVNYFLLKTILPDIRIALFAAIAMISICLYLFAWDGRILSSIRLEFLAYPHEIPTLVLFPLLIVCVLRYVREYENELWLIVSLLVVAVIGMDSLYVFWVPVFIGMPLLISCFFNKLALDRAKTIALVAEIVLVDILLLCLQMSFPLTLSHVLTPISLETAVYIWSQTTPLWVLSDNLFAAHPSYFLTKGWPVVVALPVIVAMIYYHNRLDIVKNLLQKNINIRFIVTLCAISIGYYFILFNPLLVPFLLKLFIWHYPLQRMHDPAYMLSKSIIYGALACALFIPLFYFKFFDKYFFKKMVPIVVLIICSLSPLFFSDVRTVMKDALFNSTNPNILSLPNEHPYIELARFEKGVVAIDMLKAEAVVALTPHYVVSVRRNSDISSAEQRMTDNINILSYNVDSEKMRALLLKYSCKYVVIPKDSVAVQKFRNNVVLFNEVADTGADIIYSINL